MTNHGKKCFKSSVIWQKCVSIYENYWCWWLVWDDSSASGTGTFRGGGGGWGRGGWGGGTAQFQLFLFVKITVGSWTNVWHSRIPTVMIICLVQQIRGIIQHTLEFVLNSQSSMLSSVFFNVPSNLCQHFRDTNVRNFTSEQHLCMITDLIYAALLRCSSLTPISVWFSRSEPQRTDKQHQARSKLGAGIGWRYGGLEGGVIVLDPFLVSGDMEAPELLEDSLSLSACVSRGWIVPQDALALGMLAVILRPICHSHTCTHPN